MPTYIYETVGKKRSRRYEIKQSIKDAAFTRHPDTGETIRRVPAGSIGIISRGARPAVAPCGRPAPAAHRCGAGCCCH